MRFCIGCPSSMENMFIEKFKFKMLAESFLLNSSIKPTDFILLSFIK